MNVTSTFKLEAFKSVTGTVFLVLLTIDHADLASPIRIVNDNKEIVSNGNTFVAFPFDIQLPSSIEGSPPQSRIQIDNTTREIAQAIRSITSAASVVIQIIRADDPDTIEYNEAEASLNMINVKWDMFRLSGDLEAENMTQEPYPSGEFSPAYFPAGY